jgi:molecular chaperone HscC
VIIGIDLGTTNSLCAVFENGSPRLIPNVHGNLMTPSIVGVLDDGRLVVGEPAKQLRVTSPQNCSSCFKRWMGTTRKVGLGGQELGAVELSSLILKSLKSDAEKYLGQDVDEAVITVPAYFNDNQRKATKLAGELANLKVRRIINEPTAAALVYGFHEKDSEKDIIVIDLGGGTFDVTVMEVFEGTLEIVSTAGETQLGGEDFTNRLVAWTLNQKGMQLESAEMKFPLMVSRLAEQCETAKRNLVNDQVATVRFPNEAGEFDDSADSFQVTRGILKQVVDPLVKRIERPIARALRDANKQVGQFSDVILVGGATRSLEVQECVQDMFNSPAHSNVNPDEVVALGAAIQAALITDDAAVDDMVMTDICPFTLGVEVVKEFGTKMMDGYFCPVIHRNTTIPVSKEEVLTTIKPNQKSMGLKVYQGEARKIKDNLFLGKLDVTGIPPGPSGQAVHVRFTYDLNGILEVEAYVPETGKKFNAVLTNNVSSMSEQEIKSALQRIQKLKFYPRDDIRQKNLLLFAERVIGEISPYQRNELESALDQFEHALDGGDRDNFEHTKQGLLIVLSALGYPYEEDTSLGGESGE